MNRSPIAARLTPAGSGGIGVVVVVGVGAEEVVESLFDRPLPGPGRLRLGRLLDPSTGEVVDEVLIRKLLVGENLFLPGQEAIEIDGHGGLLVGRRTLSLLEVAGAEIVGADEMIRRQGGAGLAPVTASARALLPRACTRRAARVLQAQADGALEEAIRDGGQVESLLSTAPFGRALVTPPRIALAGGANVGKSTLLNTFLGRERVLVDAHPGTTRDVVHATVVLGSLAFDLADTAGYREVPAGEIESLGIDRARESVRVADLVLFLSESTRRLTEGESSWLAELEGLAGGPRVVRVASKCDLPDSDPAEGFLPVSGLTGAGLDRLEAVILEPFASDLAAPADRPVIFEDWIEEALRAGDTHCLLGPEPTPSGEGSRSLDQGDP